ncbi:MAG: hypothetical protein NXY57DRAFT_883816 [Lentinula lateritia]|uniref:Phospholipid/glycerol acyltransferase domain-containing protein n=1 Tax=Lentinula lateritia TaxID=40482 RepID=A0ABQ8VAH9_9AGAR|nr:MAG: hypothetical protein NXY57DRAFT_883816 [Lentinula lateritia]KAJ4482669.1 hypothetical protein C8R41DRAFT_896687 [Lentinula lateritia]
MEKYSAYRDPGTGIQPFLTPIPSPSSHSAVLSAALLPIRYVVGLLRLALIILLAIVYLLGVTVFAVIPPLKRAVSSAIIRTVLFCLGFLWIPTEMVSKKRGRSQKSTDNWNPGAGDLIISNWASWVELLWLAYRFDPVFVIPIPESPVQQASSVTSSPISNTPGRRSGRSSMPGIVSASRTPSSQIQIIGFTPVSLFTLLKETGRVPPYTSVIGAKTTRTLDEIRKTSGRPVVVFPECTTSNGRGLLRFAELFKQTSLPVKGYDVFIMCVRYDPPTGHSPTVTYSIPSSSSFNPLSHVFTLASSLTIPALTIRLLTQSESPSSPTFLVNEIVGVSARDDSLTEASAILISQLGKFKRLTMGWEDKVRFLEFYGSKST